MISEKFYIDSKSIRYFDFITIYPLIRYLLYLICFLSIFYLVQSKEKKDKSDKLIDINITVFFGYIIASLVLKNKFYPNREIVFYVAEYITLLIIYFYVNSIQKETVYKILVYSGITNSVFVFIQFMLNITNFKSISDLRLFRFSGGMIDPIYASILICLSLIIIIDRKKDYTDFKYWMIVLVMTIACFMTGSRTWMLIIAAYFTQRIILKLMSIDYRSLKNKKISVKKTVFMIICVNTLIICFFTFNERIVYIIQDYTEKVIKTDFSTEETNERTLRKMVAEQIFLDNKFTGSGTETYRFYEMSFFNFNSGGSNPHNIYLQLLCENGLIGVLVFISLIILLIINIFNDKDYIKLMLLTGWLISGYFIGLLGFNGLLIFMLITCNGRKAVMIENNLWIKTSKSK